MLFTPCLLGQELKYEIKDTLISSLDATNEQDIIHYVDENNWYILAKRKPFLIDAINLNNKNRLYFQFKESETRSNVPENIYGDADMLSIVLSNKIILLDKKKNQFINIDYPKAYHFENMGMIG